MKIWKYALLGLVSLSLFSCLRGDGWEEENQPKDKLVVNIANNRVLSDGTDYLEVETRFNGELVTVEDGVKYYTNDSNFVDAIAAGTSTMLAGGPYDITPYFEVVDGKDVLRFKSNGTFSFWAEFDVASSAGKPSSVIVMEPGLSATISKSSIVADGEDFAEIEVYFDAERITSGVEFKDMDGNSLNSYIKDMKFSTKVAGDYTFYAEYNGENTSDAPMFVSAAAVEEEIIPEDGLFISVSKSVIKADGKDSAVIKVYYDGVDVTNESTMYTYPDNKECKLPGFVYTTTEVGEFRFWVAYQTASNYTKPMIIKSVSAEVDIPNRPADPSISNTSFVRRSLLMKFTGTGCGYCPLMTDRMHEVLDGTDDYPPYEDKVVVAEAHTFSASDPMYLTTRIDQGFGISGYPTLVIDMAYKYSDYTSAPGLRRVIDTSLSTPAKAGISVNAVLNGNTVVARVSVKAAVNGVFRVGGFLLESGIQAKQTIYAGATGNYDYNTHNNTIRVVDCAQSLTDYSGYDLGFLSQGNVGDYVFAIDIEEGWVKENCHLVFFVNCLEDDYYITTNAITAELEGMVQYEYIK